MIGQFLRGSALYTLSTLFTRGLGFLLLPVYTRALSLEDYGTYDFITAIGSLVGVTVALEICQGVHRFLPEMNGKDYKRAYYVSTAFWFTFCCYGALAVIAFSAAPTLAEFIFNDREKWLLVVITAILFWANANTYLITSALRANLQPNATVLIATLSAVCSAAFSLIFVLVLKWEIEGLLIGQILGNLATSIVGFRKLKGSLVFGISISALRRMLKFSIPMVPSSVGVIVSLFADRLMLKEMIGLESVGLYGVAIRVASVLSFLTIGFQYALTPLIYSKHKDPDTPANIAKIFHVFLFSSATVVLIIGLLSENITSLIVGEEFFGAASLISVLAMATVCSSMHVFFPGLALASKTKVISVINMVMALLNVGFNYMLIGLFGEAGAAYATLISVLIGLLCLSVSSQKYYRVPVNFSYIVAYFSVLVGFLVFGKGGLA